MVKVLDQLLLFTRTINPSQCSYEVLFVPLYNRLIKNYDIVEDLRVIQHIPLT